MKEPAILKSIHKLTVLEKEGVKVTQTIKGVAYPEEKVIIYALSESVMLFVTQLFTYSNSLKSNCLHVAVSFMLYDQLQLSLQCLSPVSQAITGSQRFCEFNPSRFAPPHELQRSTRPKRKAGPWFSKGQTLPA